MIVYRVIACDGYEVLDLELCLTREIAERIVAEKNAVNYANYLEWKKTDEYKDAIARPTEDDDGTFETWSQYNYDYSIREYEVVCE